MMPLIIKLTFPIKPGKYLFKRTTRVTSIPAIEGEWSVGRGYLPFAFADPRYPDVIEGRPAEQLAFFVKVVGGAPHLDKVLMRAGRYYYLMEDPGKGVRSLDLVLRVDEPRGLEAILSVLKGEIPREAISIAGIGRWDMVQRKWMYSL